MARLSEFMFFIGGVITMAGSCLVVYGLLPKIGLILSKIISYTLTHPFTMGIGLIIIGMITMALMIKIDIPELEDD